MISNTKGMKWQAKTVPDTFISLSRMTTGALSEMTRGDACWVGEGLMVE